MDHRILKPLPFKLTDLLFVVLTYSPLGVVGRRLAQLTSPPPLEVAGG